MWYNFSYNPQAKKSEPFPVITRDNKMITAHRVGWKIWIGQIVEILGIKIHKQNCLDWDAQQRVGMKI